MITWQIDWQIFFSCTLHNAFTLGWGGVKFKPPMPFAFSFHEDSLYSKIDLPSYSIFALLLWGMKNIYGTSKDHANVQGQQALSNWMISFESLTHGVICTNYEIPSCLLLFSHGKVYSNIWRGHLWMITMSFAKSMELRLKIGTGIGHATIFFIT